MLDPPTARPATPAALTEAMRAALTEAQRAFDAKEVPVGAVVLHRGEIIAAAHNQTRSLSDPTAHAEVLALRAAATNLGNARLSECTLVCTLEPCVMCVGALIHARIAQLIFAANEPKTGACGSAFDLLSDPAHLHRVKLEKGLLAADSIALLQRFFAGLRQ